MPGKLLQLFTEHRGSAYASTKHSIATLESNDGSVAIHGYNYGYGYGMGYSTHKVPSQRFDGEEGLEKALALGLIAASGGRALEVSAWEHLPPLWYSVFEAGYTRPSRIIGHPETLQRLTLGCLQSDGNRSALVKLDSSLLMDAELTESFYMPLGTVVLLAQGHNLGSIYNREHYNRNREVVYGGYEPLGMSKGYDPYIQCGVTFNSMALATVHCATPPPKKLNAWDRVLREQFTVEAKHKGEWEFVQASELTHKTAWARILDDVIGL